MRIFHSVPIYKAVQRVDKSLFAFWEPIFFALFRSVPYDRISLHVCLKVLSIAHKTVHGWKNIYICVRGARMHTLPLESQDVLSAPDLWVLYAEKNGADRLSKISRTQRARERAPGAEKSRSCICILEGRPENDKSSPSRKEIWVICAWVMEFLIKKFKFSIIRWSAGVADAPFTPLSMTNAHAPTSRKKWIWHINLIIYK